MNQTLTRHEEAHVPLSCLVVFGAAVLAMACEKGTPPPDRSAPKDTATSSSASPTASVAVPSPSASTSAVATAIAPVATGGDAVSDAGKGKDGGSVALLKPVTKHVTGSNFALDVSSPVCKASSECAMTIKLAAAGDYHVNKEYPYKFIATASPGIEFLGKPDAMAFTRAAGDFTEQGEKTGTMTVRFKPTSPGEAHVTGTYKFSVCSADQCQIEQEKLDLAVPIM